MRRATARVQQKPLYRRQNHIAVSDDDGSIVGARRHARNPTRLRYRAWRRSYGEASKDHDRYFADTLA
jgi:hypothetical protein